MGIWRTLAGIFALALFAGVSHAETGLDRLSKRDDLFGWEAVGKVEIGQGGYCTGVLIAPDLVLTAGHCIFNRGAKAPRDPSTIRFSAAQTNGADIAERVVARMVADPAYTPYTPISAETVRHDVALLQLAQPIPTSVASPFNVGAIPAKGAEVSVVSYAQGRAEALSWQKACTVFGQGNGLVGFDCDVGHGSSGAPVFDRSPLASGGRARIVSLVSAGSRKDGKVKAYGMALPAIVSELKSALRSGRGVISGSTSQAAAMPEIRQGAPSKTGPRILSGGSTGAKFLRP